jgi:hypothetical protein
MRCLEAKCIVNDNSISGNDKKWVQEAGFKQPTATELCVHGIVPRIMYHVADSDDPEEDL